MSSHMAVACEDTATAVTAQHAGPAARTAGWWQAWRARFGLAEVCGTAAAVAGFAVGYLPDRSLLAAARTRL